MNVNYNPFSKDDYIKTEHGVIGIDKLRYFTHRKPEHIFKKHRAFGISMSEIEHCYKEHVDHIIIKYYGDRWNIIYKIDFEKVKYMNTYDNNGDLQILLPINEMVEIGREILNDNKLS